MPRVSVIIPTFNCGRFLARAINSAIAQTYTDHEVIVVDDGSTDNTREVVAQFGSRVRYFCQSNKGPASARNVGLSQASGELIAYLDGDDMWYPHKLGRQVAFLDAHKECGLVHSDATIIDERDRVIVDRVHRETKIKVQRGYCLMELLRDNYVTVATVVERRECIEHNGRFDERLKGPEDRLQWIMVLMDGMALGYMDEPLGLYRRRAGSITADPRKMAENRVKMYQILLTEKSLALRFGQEAAAIARDQLCLHECELAYLDRMEGRTDDARRRLLRLVQESPLQTALYAELLKACVPQPVATTLRWLRESWA